MYAVIIVSEMFIAQCLISCLNLCHTQHCNSMRPMLGFPQHRPDYVTTLAKHFLFPTEASPNSLEWYPNPSQVDMTLFVFQLFSSYYPPLLLALQVVAEIN